MKTLICVMASIDLEKISAHHLNSKADWSNYMLPSDQCGPDLYMDDGDRDADGMESRACNRGCNDPLVDEMPLANGSSCLESNYEVNVINNSSSADDLQSTSSMWHSSAISSRDFNMSSESNDVYNTHSTSGDGTQNTSCIPTAVEEPPRTPSNENDYEEETSRNDDDSGPTYLDGDVEDAYHAIFGDDIQGSRGCPGKKVLEDRDRDIRITANNFDDTISKNAQSLAVGSRKHRKEGASDNSIEGSASVDKFYRIGLNVRITDGIFLGYIAEIICIVDNKSAPRKGKGRYRGVYYAVAPRDTEGSHLGSCVLLTQDQIERSHGDQGVEIETGNCLCNNTGNHDNCNKNSPNNLTSNGLCMEDNKELMTTIGNFSDRKNSDDIIAINVPGSRENSDFKKVEVVCSTMSGAEVKEVVSCDVVTGTSFLSSVLTPTESTGVELSSTCGEIDKDGSAAVAYTVTSSSGRILTENANSEHGTTGDDTVSGSLKRKIDLTTSSACSTQPRRKFLRHPTALKRYDNYIALRSTDMRTVGRRVRVTAEGSKYR